LSDEIARIGNSDSIDVIELKYQLVTRFLATLSKALGNTMKRDWECLEWMRDRLEDAEREGGYLVDHQYSELLSAGWKSLQELANSTTTPSQFASKFIVEAPVLFSKTDLSRVRKVVRGFQHQYYRDLFVDIAVMPRVLSKTYSKGYRSQGENRTFSGVLVPRGPVSAWGSSSNDLEPLEDEKVKNLELPYGRALLVCPQHVGRARGMYLFDRFVSSLRNEGITTEDVRV
jgi:hypothetical protein